MTTEPEKLTDAIVKALEKPESGNRVYYDSEVGGFGCRVTKAGARSFVLTYRSGGRQRRMTIGQYPTWSVAAARKRASELRKAVDNGEDPMGDRQARREAPTVSDLWDKYADEHLPRKRSADGDKALWRNILKPALGALKVADVQHGDITSLHRKATKANGAYQANRAAALASKLFSLACRWGWRTDNPVVGLERNPEAKRSRYMKPAELVALSGALAERKDASANAVRLLLLTGARRGEALSALWGHFDLEAGIWTKPSAHTKQKTEHRIPLSAPALQLLTDMRGDRRPDDDEPLFPGRGTDAPQASLKKAWRSIIERATVLLFAADVGGPAGKLVATLRKALDRDPSIPELEAAAVAAKVKLPVGLRDLRVHDLRHSYASFLASAGLSLPVIGQLLGHTQPATTARYAHLLDDPLRQATDRVGALIAGAGKPVGEVVPMRRGGS